jgi:hypothetical protein
MNDPYLNTLLLSLVGSVDLVKLWWNGPNLGFDGRCPKDVPDVEVRAYLEGYCFGK